MAQAGPSPSPAAQAEPAGTPLPTSPTPRPLLVDNVTGKTMSQEEALQNYVDRFSKDPVWEGKVPLSFYGKVVDENNQPVAGASIRLQWNTTRELGGTAYGGVYQNSAAQRITLNPKSGLGDVVATIGDRNLAAECKGGILNTRHAGQVSRLYKGLCETVGMLMATPREGRQVAVVPRTDGTLRLARRLAPRCALAGIEIALVGSRGEVIEVAPALVNPLPVPSTSPRQLRSKDSSC